ncbi:MAG: hypothetical protein ABR589_11170 [Chthoniobacterales bacterium]
MKKSTSVVVAVTALAALTVTSCETPTGQGAAIGAGTGAVVGAIASGGAPGTNRAARGALAGAAIGAGAGALIGAAVEADRATAYGPPRSTYPYGRRVGGGLVESPYPPYQVYDLRGVPPGSLVDDRVGRGYFRKP